MPKLEAGSPLAIELKNEDGSLKNHDELAEELFARLLFDRSEHGAPIQPEFIAKLREATNDMATQILADKETFERVAFGMRPKDDK